MKRFIYCRIYPRTSQRGESGSYLRRSTNSTWSTMVCCPTNTAQLCHSKQTEVSGSLCDGVHLGKGEGHSTIYFNCCSTWIFKNDVNLLVSPNYIYVEPLYTHTHTHTHVHTHTHTHTNCQTAAHYVLLSLFPLQTPPLTPLKAVLC